jgi:hypothetical protein
LCQAFPYFAEVTAKHRLTTGNQQKHKALVSGLKCHIQPLGSGPLLSKGDHLLRGQPDIAHFTLQVAPGSQFKDSADWDAKASAFAAQNPADISISLHWIYSFQTEFDKCEAAHV